MLVEFPGYGRVIVLARRLRRIKGGEMIEHRLNEYGKLVFKHKTNPNLFAERSYDWVDRIVVIDETEGRRLIQDTKFSTFDLSAWEPMTREEYSSIKRKYNEIHKKVSNKKAS